MELVEIRSYKIDYSGVPNYADIAYNRLKTLVGPAGLEPATLCLEGRCSIHLSYGPKIRARFIIPNQPTAFPNIGALLSPSGISFLRKGSRFSSNGPARPYERPKRRGAAPGVGE